MSRLDRLKEEIRTEASDNPDKFFATDVLRERGFKRAQCENCDLYFWRQNEERKLCGEPECSGGYTFIGDSPVSKKYSYTESWEMFRDFMDKRGYQPIDRYPVVARWRDDTDFVEAAIYNFQPHVVSGEVEPPAPELVVPQPSLRFNDIDNVGVTGRHYVLHNHIGQTCFRKSEEYDQDRYFKDMLEFALDELGVPEDKLILHEDAWGGGGNLGACMEFFVDGLELWNQVYMFYEIREDGYEELDLKVLDMGMGHERITWISHGTETSYESVMPQVLEKMKEETGVEVNEDIWQDFLPHSGKLNVDEVEDIEYKWNEIADDIGSDVEELKKEIKPVAALYSVAEHTRALLFALNDGKLPSNTGGGHNLRVIYRRAQDFIEKYDWDLEIGDIAEWHADELSGIFPDLKDNIEEVKKILEVEEDKYYNAREKAREKLESLDEQPSTEEMVELYESHGVSPEMMEEFGYEVPEDFYSMLAGDEENEDDQEEEEFDNTDFPDTEEVFYKDETRRECDAEVLAVLPNHWVVLDRTVFYPEGGGQKPDRGYLVGDSKSRVIDVQKQDGVIFHKAPDHSFEEGEKVRAKLDWDHRFQLMQHHSITHVVNGVTEELLGGHIWQAGAKKTDEKARLDITHYEKLSRNQLDEIEDEVNNIIQENHGIKKKVIPRSEAERKYGFRIYQGGAVPGNKLRIVSIEDVDIEACGGTHLADTKAAGQFLITRSTKVQDGVIRLEFKAGKAARKHLNQVEERLEKIAVKLEAVTSIDQPRKVQEELCNILSVEPEHLNDTIDRFREENDDMQRKIEALSDYLGSDIEPAVIESTGTLNQSVERLYEAWKQNEKKVDRLEGMIEQHVKQNIEERTVEEKVPTENMGLLIQVAKDLAKEYSASVTLIGQKGAVSASYHEDYDADENLRKHAENIQGDENFAKSFEI